VALESTGVYWWPVFNLLEEAGLPLTLVNPRQTKGQPGRKTDVGDATWLADLLRHGLVRASFIPPAAIRALRELTRYRAAQVRQRAYEANRLHKVLESANLKLAAVASDIPGASGRQMLGALAAGEEDPAALAQMAKAGLRNKLDALEQALTGRVKPHHRTLIRASLDQLRFLERTIEQRDEEVARAMAPFAAQRAALDLVPGIDRVAAAAIVAEIGVAMDRFPTEGHLASWAGVCPGNKQSGGRRLSGATTKGNVWLRRILGGASWARWPGRRSTGGAASSAPATTGSSRAWGPSRRWWRSCPSSSSASTTSSRPGNPTANSAPTTTAPATPSARPAGSPSGSSASAIR
jgi:transposase